MRVHISHSLSPNGFGLSWMRTSIHRYMHSYTQIISLYTCVHNYTHTHTYLYIYPQTYSCSTSIYERMNIHVYSFKHRHMHASGYAHQRIHACTHAYAGTSSLRTTTRSFRNCQMLSLRYICMYACTYTYMV